MSMNKHLSLPVIAGLPTIDSPGIAPGKLAAPPALWSTPWRLDLAAVVKAQNLQTPEGDAWARRMDTDGTYRMWMDLARRRPEGVGAAQSWLGAALVASTLAAAGAATSVMKERYDRPRPFVTVPELTVPVRRLASYAYPSGHASAAYAAARVIATMNPGLAEEAYSLAKQVAVSRVYAGAHYPTDVVAGAQMGTYIADRVLGAAMLGRSKPAFAPAPAPVASPAALPVPEPVPASRVAA